MRYSSASVLSRGLVVGLTALAVSWTTSVCAQISSPPAIPTGIVLQSGTPMVLPSSAVNAAMLQQAQAAQNTQEQQLAQQKQQQKQQRMQQLQSLTFDRRPSAILKLWSQKANQPEQASPSDSPTSSTAAATKAGETQKTEAATKADSSTAKPAMSAEEKTTTPASDTAAKSTPVESEEKPETPASTPTDTPADKPEADKSEADKSETDKPATEKPATEKSAEEIAKEKQAEQAKKQAEERAALEAERKLFTETLKLLQESVTLGDWPQLQELLKNRDRLSEEEAVLVYNRILDQMTVQPGMNMPVMEGLSDEMRQQLEMQMQHQLANNPTRQYAEKHSLDLADISGLIHAQPKKLDDSQIRRLGSLLRIVLSSGYQVEPFLSAAKTFPDEVLPKIKTALLLHSAGLNQHTADFLPDLETAVKDKNAQAVNLLALNYQALHQLEGKESLREQAWEATLKVLEITKGTSAEREQALTRAVAMAPQLQHDKGKAWLESCFQNQQEVGQEILAKIGTSTAQNLAQNPHSTAPRERGLKLQHSAVNAYLQAVQEVTPQWNGILNLLANNWLKEAQVAQQFSNMDQYGPSMRRDAYGNLYYTSFDDMGMTQQIYRQGQIRPTDVNIVLDTAPLDRWYQAIEPSKRPEFTRVLCQLWLKVNEDARAFPYIEELSQTHPLLARELAEEFLRVWTKNNNPNQQRQRTNYYMFMYGFEQKADRIPLTRSKQERNLRDLSEWISRLRQIPLEGKLNESLLVEAFTTCHSAAEVYDVADIEKVFGAWDTVESATMANLIQKMRLNLAGLWRDPNVQRDAKTNRKKSDIQAEVLRGYAVANRVLGRALEKHPEDWQLLLTKACVLHDENDYQNELAVSSEFSLRRQAALEAFAEAARAYIQQVAELSEQEQKTEVFDYWFYASLGATDLRGLSEKNTVIPGEIPKIAEALNSLTGEIGTRHQDQFANALFTRMSAVSPACKFRYLEAGFQLVGDNPKAQEARKVYDYYKDLVTELQLVARLDGNASVGHEEPFGIYIDLRHTKELERESGGFSKYLTNQNNLYWSYNYGRPTENYRDKFQDAATVILQEHFEVLSITFNHAETQSRSDDQPGWRVTPYAHILLKAKGPEVDKVPALKLDLDFLDTSGYVALPISSSPLPIDASRATESENWANLKMVSLLDERQASAGKLSVEIRVNGQGLVPPLSQLLNPQVAGFKLVEQEDSGVSVIEFDKAGPEPVVLSERTCTLKYEAADPAMPTPTEFTFPEPLVELEEVSYQRYVDADLEEVAATVPLVEKYSSNSRVWRMTILGSLAGLLALAGGIFYVRSRAPEQATTEHQELPLTPFSILNRLKSLEHNPLSSEQKQQLQSDIRVLERHYFAETNGHIPPDLRSMAARWS